MGTAKRERQKANRQLRLEELAKQARKEKSKRFTMRIGLAVVALVALVGVVYLLNGGDDDSTAAATTTIIDPTLTTIDPNAPTTTFVPAPEKPVVTPPEGPVTELKVTTLSEGTGDVVAAGDTIDVYYVGITSDGAEFDGNYESGTGPISFAVGVGQLIEGWDQGLVGLKVGGQYRLDIPVDLAYGADAAANGRPAGDLTFIIDIVGVTHVAAPETTAGEATETTGAGTETTIAAPATT